MDKSPVDACYYNGTDDQCDRSSMSVTPFDFFKKFRTMDLSSFDGSKEYGMGHTLFQP